MILVVTSRSGACSEHQAITFLFIGVVDLLREDHRRRAWLGGRSSDACRLDSK